MKSIKTTRVLIFSHVITGIVVYLFYAGSFAARDDSEIVRGIIFTPLLLVLVGSLVSIRISFPLKFTLVTVPLSSLFWVISLQYLIETPQVRRPIGEDMILSLKFAFFAMFLSSPVLFAGAIVQLCLIKILQKYFK